MGHDVAQIPRLMLAASASGQGKTSLCCALLQAALNAGRKPRSFKCGPDYIDPMFHQTVLGVPSRNLDLYFSTPDEVRQALCDNAAGGDLSLLEGVMGFYDGVGGTDEASSWHLARVTETPVVLSVIPKGTSLTLAAVLRGLQSFRTPDMLRGVILNECSEKLWKHLAPIITRETGLPVFGYVPKYAEWTIPSRHLGLIAAGEVSGLKAKMEKMGEQLAETVDVSALLQMADSAPPLELPLQEKPAAPGPRVKIALARDQAFSFYYRENLELLERSGAQLVPFSPLEDGEPPEGACGIYLGGGYPELHCEELSGNVSMRRAIQEAVRAGMPVLAECGGFLYLQQQLEDDKGRDWPMAGVLEGRAFHVGRLTRFGYLELTAKEDFGYLLPGETIRGHEFHHWDCSDNGSLCRAEKPAGGGGWDCMVRYKNCLAGFPHLYFQSNPAFAVRFVETCRQFGRKSR